MEEALLGSLVSSFAQNMIQSYFNRSDFRYTHNMTNIPAQVREMREAGLNPALAYGQISAPQGQNLGNYQSDFGKTAKDLMDLPVMKQEIATKSAEEMYYKALADKTRTENRIFTFNADHQQELFDLDRNFKGLQITGYQLDNEGRQLKNVFQRIENDIRKIDFSRHEEIVEAELQKIMSQYLLFGAQANAINRKLPYEISKLVNETTELITRTSMNYDLGEYYKSGKILNESNREMIDLANDWEKYLTDNGADFRGKSLHELRGSIINALTGLIPNFSFYRPLGTYKHNPVGFRK